LSTKIKASDANQKPLHGYESLQPSPSPAEPTAHHAHQVLNVAAKAAKMVDAQQSKKLQLLLPAEPTAHHAHQAHNVVQGNVQTANVLNSPSALQILIYF
jgi:truncated hemoglobin YjbI